MDPRDAAGQPDRREWLVANGLGGYAGGTVGGANTRRYHGLLVAALEPPGRRRVLLARVDERVEVGGAAYELGAAYWRSGALAPRGFEHLAGFSAEPVPTWEYRVGAGRLRKRVACPPGRNEVLVGYRLLDGPPVELELKLLANDRDFHADTHGHPDWHFRQEPLEAGLRVAAWDGATPWRLDWDAGADFRAEAQWYWGAHYPDEAARGLAAEEDLYCLGRLRVRLAAGESFELRAGLEPLGERPRLDRLVAAREARLDGLLARSGLPPTAPARALLAAADQFLVRRDSTAGSTVIAGYHWFGDWGRDTMIALPGLTLATRRFDEAAGILRTFARYVDRGMLPNRFPDYPGEPPEYNTVDATLWWFHALDRYCAASGDLDLAREQLPLLAEVVEWHLRGTRHGIRVDPADGLLAAGEPGVQLTWMDAKIGDWVVTPRVGKPVEVNALWLNALEVMAELGARLGRDGSRYRELADRARFGLQRFWSPAHGYLYDVIGPDGVGDPTLRPNQLVALSLPRRALPPARERAVLAAVRRHLLTPYGLRTLPTWDSAYAGTYAGDAVRRDSVYHQGTVWPWLIGPYCDALVQVLGPTPAALAEARRAIAPLLDHLVGDGCLGSVSEIFDADPPHAPRGCVAQAWSVAELLRAYALIEATAAGSAAAATGRPATVGEGR